MNQLFQKITEIYQKLSKFDFKIIDYSIGKPIDGNDQIFIKKYQFQKPEDTLKFKCGTCWDISAAAKFQLQKLGIQPIVIYYQSDQKSDFPANHMFLIIDDNQKFYSFEASWSKFLGIHGPYNSIMEICEQYAKKQILSVKNIEVINFYKVIKFPQYFSNVKSFMSQIKNNQLIYTYSTKLSITEQISRYLSQSYHNVINEEQKYTLHDIIYESELPSPYFLKKDIQDKIQKTNLIKYTKNDIQKFINGWKFQNQFKNISDKFTLTIIECYAQHLKQFVGFNVEVQGSMCQFVNPNNIWNDEYIWINKKIIKDYDDSFLTLLGHQLGHVWTSIFGHNNQNFEKGRTNFNHENVPSINQFNSFQKDIFLTLYNGKYDLLKNDYEYILKNDENQNWQLTTHCDEIIEILVQDCLKYHNNEDTELYLANVFNKIQSNDYKSLSLLKTYKNSETYSNFKDSNYIKNIIRRLFLLFSFGNQKQIDYFKNMCNEQFGKINE